MLQPVGSKVYVPELFYQRLYRGAAALAQKPEGWLMASGSYRASLAREAASQRLVVERLTAGFDLHVFSRGAGPPSVPSG